MLNFTHHRFAKAMVTLAHAANPPLCMRFGTDTVTALEEKKALVARELAEWRDLAISTDFPADASPAA